MAENKNNSLLKLAQKYYEENNYIQSLNHYLNFVKNEPNTKEIHFIYNNIGNCYKSINKLKESLDYYNLAITNDKNYISPYINKSLVLIDIGKSNDAIECIETALSFNNKDSNIYNTLGFINVRMGNINEAISAFNNAITIDKNNIQALKNLSSVYFSVGEKSKASNILKKLLKLNPGDTEAFRNLVLNKEVKLNDKTTSTFIKRYNKNNNLINNYKNDNEINNLIMDQAQIGFALGQLYDDEKQFDLAFNFFLEANQNYRKLINYDIDVEKKLFDQIKNSFDREILQQIKLGNPSGQAIFIVGMPRSGSTLLEQILANHSRIYSFGEIEDLKQVAGEALNLIPSNNVNDIKSLSSDELFQLGESYFFRKKNYIDPKTLTDDRNRFVDKQLLNFIYLGFIKMILPNSKIIHIKRNMIDNIFSIFSILFTGNHPYAYDLDELFCYYNLYNDIMNHWKETIPESFKEIKYEDLINNTKKTVSDVFDYLELPFENKTLEFYKTKRFINTSSSLQVRKKIYASSIKRWKNYEKHLEKYI